MSLASPVLALIYRARSQGVHLRVQVNFPNPSLLRTAGFRTFLVSRGLLRRCHLVGRGRLFMGVLPACRTGRLIRRSRGVTPSSPIDPLGTPATAKAPVSSTGHPSPLA